MYLSIPGGIHFSTKKKGKRYFLLYVKYLWSSPLTSTTAFLKHWRHFLVAAVYTYIIWIMCSRCQLPQPPNIWFWTMKMIQPYLRPWRMFLSLVWIQLCCNHLNLFRIGYYCSSFKRCASTLTYCAMLLCRCTCPRKTLPIFRESFSFTIPHSSIHRC